MDERLAVDELGYTDDGIVHLTDAFRLPGRAGHSRDAHPRAGDERRARTSTRTRCLYFLSRITIERGGERPADRDQRMARWRKRLFIGLAHNAASPAAYFCLPVDRTVVMASQVEL